MTKKKNVSLHIINLVLLCLALTLHLNPEVQSRPLNSRRCSYGKVFLWKHVQTPGCYNKVHLYHGCLNNKQCADLNAFCGFDDTAVNLTEQTVCICNDDAKEVNGQCVIREYCNLSGYNPDQLQGNCSKPSMICAHNRCLCRSDHTYNRKVDDCVLAFREERGEKKEVGKADTGKVVPNWGKSVNKSNSSTIIISSPHNNNHIGLIADAIAIFLSLIIVLTWIFYHFLKWFIPKKYASVPKKEEIALSDLQTTEHNSTP